MPSSILFLTIILEFIQFNLRFSMLCCFDLIWQFVQKYITQLANKSNWLIDLVSRRNIKNMSTMIRNSLNYFEGFN